MEMTLKPSLQLQCRQQGFSPAAISHAPNSLQRADLWQRHWPWVAVAAAPDGGYERQSIEGLTFEVVNVHPSRWQDAALLAFVQGHGHPEWHLHRPVGLEGSIVRLLFRVENASELAVPQEHVHQKCLVHKHSVSSTLLIMKASFPANNINQYRSNQVNSGLLRTPMQARMLFGAPGTVKLGTMPIFSSSAKNSTCPKARHWVTTGLRKAGQPAGRREVQKRRYCM